VTGGAPVPPPAAREVFGAAEPKARRYADWLAGPGVERGLLGPREVDRLWGRHLLNSAALAPLLPSGALVVDVGSGAGLPGIPLLLARPDLRMTLAEPLLRRVTFLEEVCRDLGLDVDVQRRRAEELPRAGWQVVVARAVAPLSRLVPLTLPLLQPAGMVVALKGRSAGDEVEAARSQLRRAGAIAEVRVLPVPGESEPTRAVVVVAGKRARRG
jgi:16S rRNA (guanine527-N7)-methyltransferase